MKTGLRKNIAPSWMAFAVILLLVLFVWLLSGFLLYSMKDRGTFGDMFGAVNALFSGFGFASLIYTIYIQRREIRLQQEQLSLTKEEIQDQKEQLLIQNEVLKTQNFENTFFQMLRLLNDIILDMKIDKKEGRACFFSFFASLRMRYHRLQEIKKISSADMKKYENSIVEAYIPGFLSDKAIQDEFKNSNECDLIQIAYKHFYIEYEDDVSHYFRTLYNIIKFVDESAVEKKKSYTNLVRAQLSSYEILLLFYNCQSTLGGTKFKALVEKYALFKSLPLNLLFDFQHKALYKDGAYTT